MYSDKWYQGIGYCLTIGIVRINNFGGSLSIEVALRIDFRDCALIGIVWTIDVWCFSNKWNCPDKWARRLPIDWNCAGKWFHRLPTNWNCLSVLFREIYLWVGLVGATTVKDRPLIGIARTIGFGSDLPMGIVMTIEFNPFRTAVPFWGQTTWNSSGLSPKRDCGSKRVALLYESWQLVAELQWIWTVHSSTTMLGLPLQQDRELSFTHSFARSFIVPYYE